MTESKREMVRMPPFEELDEYEKELCQSADPADHTALLMRIALKGIGIDPDGDDWYVSGHKMESSDPNLVIEEQKVHYRPVVKKVYKLPQITGRTFLPGRTTGELELTSLMFPSPGSDERMINCKVHGWTEATMPDANHNVYCSKCMGGPTQSWLNKQAAVHVDKKVSPGLPGVVNLNWPKLTSIDSYQVKGRGTVKVVKATRRLLDIMASMHSDPGEHSYRHVEIDGESWIIVNFEYQGTPRVGDHICLVVKKPVMGMRAREQLANLERCSPGCRGFDIFDAGFIPPEGWVHIERCDECDVYPDDLAAARTISLNAKYWCIDCEVSSSECQDKDCHSWRVIVPVQDAEHAGLLGKMECEDEEHEGEDG